MRDASRKFGKIFRLDKIEKKTHNQTTGERQRATWTALFFLDEGRVKFYKGFGERGGEGWGLWLHYLPCERTYATDKNATDIYTQFTAQTSTNVPFEPIHADEVMVMRQ